MANYQLNGVYSFGQPRHGPATMYYLPPNDPSVYNKDYLKPSGFLNKRTPYGKNAYGFQLPPDDTDKYGWKCASIDLAGKPDPKQFNKNYLKIPGRQGITVPASRPNSIQDRLSVFKQPADGDLTPAGAPPTNQGTAVVNSMSPIELAKMLMKSEEINSQEYLDWGRLVKFFTAFELLKAKGPLTPIQQKDYDDTFEFMKTAAIEKLQTTPPPLNPFDDDIKDLDAARGANPSSTFNPIGTPPAGAPDPAVASLGDLAANRAVNAATTAQAAATAAATALNQARTATTNDEKKEAIRDAKDASDEAEQAYNLARRERIDAKRVLVKGSSERARADKAVNDALASYRSAYASWQSARKGKLKNRLPPPQPPRVPLPPPPSIPQDPKSPSSSSSSSSSSPAPAPAPAPVSPETMTDLLKIIKSKYAGDTNKEFWNKVAFSLDDTIPFYKKKKDGNLVQQQPGTDKLIEPFLKNSKNQKAQNLVSYLSTTNKQDWDMDEISKIADGTVTIRTGSGQSGSGQSGGFFLSALAGIAIPAIISAISGSGQSGSGSGFTHYKPKQKKNNFSYLN